MNNCGSSRPAWMKHKKLKTGEKLHRLHDRGRRTFHCGRDMFRRREHNRSLKVSAPRCGDELWARLFPKALRAGVGIVQAALLVSAAARIIIPLDGATGCEPSLLRRQSRHPSPLYRRRIGRFDLSRSAVQFQRRLQRPLRQKSGDKAHAQIKAFEDTWEWAWKPRRNMPK
jgi:hypothetical protein